MTAANRAEKTPAPNGVSVVASVASWCVVGVGITFTDRAMTHSAIPRREGNLKEDERPRWRCLWCRAWNWIIRSFCWKCERDRCGNTADKGKDGAA